MNLGVVILSYLHTAYVIGIVDGNPSPLHKIFEINKNYS